MQRLLPFLVLLAIAACSKKGNNTTTNTPPKTTTPLADFTFTGDTFTHSALTFTPNITTAVTWHFGDGATSTLQQPSYSYPLPGTYQVMMIADTDTVRKAIHIGTGLHRLQRFKKWYVSGSSAIIINNHVTDLRGEMYRDVYFSLGTLGDKVLIMPADTTINPTGESVKVSLAYTLPSEWRFQTSGGSYCLYNISKDSISFILRASKDGRLYQLYYSTIR